MCEINKSKIKSSLMTTELEASNIRKITKMN